jgi:hypothetical protein
MSKLSYLVDACKSGDTRTTARFLQNPSVDPSYKNNAALKEASRNGHLSLVELLTKDLRVNNKTKSKNEALCLAAENGHYDVVQYLLADPRVDSHGDNDDAVSLAFSNGYYDIVELLLKFDSMSYDNKSISFMLDYYKSPTSNNFKTCKNIRYDTQLDLHDNWFIRHASAIGDLDTVEWLLSNPKVDPSANNNEAARSALKNGHIKVFERLMKDKRVEYIDYPFSKWEDFYNAFYNCFCENTDLVQEEYPEYLNFVENGGDDRVIMLDILQKNPTKEWAQEGLDGLIRACAFCESCIDKTFILGLKGVVEKMVEMGAIIDIRDTIMTPFHSERADFAVECQFVGPKAYLLILFHESFDVEMPEEIRQATPIYWEDMIVDAGNLDEKYTYNEAYYNYMKFIMDASL